MLLQKRQIVTAVAGVALLTGMGISVRAAFAQSSTSPSTTTPATSPTTAPATSPATSPTTAPATSPTITPRTQNRTMTAEKHPDLQAALRHLKLAKTELQKGAHDFKGERVEALKDTDKAIAEIEKALKIDHH